MDDQQRARELLAAEYEKDAPESDIPKRLRDHSAQIMFWSDEVAIRAITAALRAAPEWQPIKTAPTDGTEYLATNGAECRVENQPEGHAPGAWHLVDGRWAGSAFGSSQLSTHWIPLPVLPLAARPQGVKDA